VVGIGKESSVFFSFSIAVKKAVERVNGAAQKGMLSFDSLVSVAGTNRDLNFHGSAEPRTMVYLKTIDRRGELHETQ
jgi:hypothetical protein